MNKSENFQFDNMIPKEDLGNGVQRQVYGYGENIMLVKAYFEAGTVGVLHSHHHAQVTYVESGEFKMTIGDEVKILSKGDGYYVPPFIEHGCTCIQSGLLIDVFSPIREDFLVK